MSDSRTRAHPILVVEDVVEMRELLLRLLRVLGYGPIVAAKSGQEAATLLQGARFDLVLCDWNLPGYTGLELLQQLRAQTRAPTQAHPTPFIMITGEVQRDRIQAAIAAGVTDYLLKPFTLATLESKLNRALAAPHAAGAPPHSP